MSITETADRVDGVVDGASTVPRSVGRVLDLFEIVLAAGACNLTTAAAAADLTPTTALRHLRALETRGYVARSGAGTFSVGPTMLRLAAAVREGGPLDRLIAAAHPHLQALAAETGESTYLAVSDGTTATYVATAESDRAIRHVGWVGQDVPLTDTALGEALAAPGTVVVRTGAVEPDITAISLALTDAPLEAAISVVGPRHRFTEATRSAHRTALIGAVEQIGRILGDDHADRQRRSS